MNFDTKHQVVYFILVSNQWTKSLMAMFRFVTWKFSFKILSRFLYNLYNITKHSCRYSYTWTFNLTSHLHNKIWIYIPLGCLKSLNILWILVVIVTTKYRISFKTCLTEYCKLGCIFEVSNLTNIHKNTESLALKIIALFFPDEFRDQNIWCHLMKLQKTKTVK